jgi:hypothetical protein
VVHQIDVEPGPAPAAAVRPRRWPLAIATAACTAAVLVSDKTAPPAIVVTLILLGALGSIELSRREARQPGGLRPIAWTIAALYTLAVVRPPRFATDIWSYTMVGRILAVHHLNPYRASPASVAADPLLHLLHHTWRFGTTPYGPLFVLHSGFVALISGTHPLAYRLAFQLTSMIAIGIALWLLWRATHSTAAVALVGLNPAVAGSIVNGGHNDALVALGLLGVVLLLDHDRTRTAGWVLVAAVLVKISIAFAIIPLALWVLTRRGVRALVMLLAPTVVVGGGLILFVPGALHSMTNANGGVVTRLSIWNIPQRVTWFGFANHPGAKYATAGLVAVVAVALFGAVVGRRFPDSGRGAAIGAASWLVAAGYVLAWYTVLGLLVAALRPTDRLARWFAVQGGLITAAFLIPRDDLTAMPVLGRIVMFYVPLALTVGFVWAMVPMVSDARRARLLATTDRTSPTATA